jgi:hypothetical protein
MCDLTPEYRQFFKDLAKTHPEDARWFRENDSRQLTMDHTEFPAAEETFHDIPNPEKVEPTFIPIKQDLTKHQRKVLDYLQSHDQEEAAKKFKVKTNAIRKIIQHIWDRV